MIAKAVNVRACLLFVMVAVTICFSCEDEAPEQDHRGFNDGHVRPGTPSIDAHKQLNKKKTGLVENATIEEGDALELPRLTEVAFIQGPSSRDPFMPFVEVLTRGTEMESQVQREVKLKDYDITDLNLIGIVTNIGDPRAMVTTAEGTGFVLRRGDYVGRADFISQGGSSEPIQLNWRVARIHGSGKEEERGIYFIRDDPTTTKGVDITRFLALHPHID
jgi:Tfp pilus assembly protein PilP